MTAVKEDEQWFPVALYTDKGVVLKSMSIGNLGKISLGGTQEEAMEWTRRIAGRYGRECIPPLDTSAN